MFKVLPKKVWIPIMIAAVVFLFGGVMVYQYWWLPKEEVKNQTNLAQNNIKDETVGWKIYKNERFDYEIKYPSFLQFQGQELDKYGISSVSAPAVSWIFPADENSNVGKFIDLIVTDKGTNDSLDSILNSNKGCIVESEDVGEQTTRISCDFEDEEGKLISFIKISDSKIYAINLSIIGMESLNGMDFSSEINTYNQMLSTFNFDVLKGSSIVENETVGWGSYRNEGMGFEIKYPKGSEIKERDNNIRIDIPSESDNVYQKYFTISLFSGSIDNCLNPLNWNIEKTENIKIADKNFVKKTGGMGVNSGDYYGQLVYSLGDSGKCFSFNGIIYFHKSGVMYSINPPISDREKESKIFEEILSTFKFLQ